MKVHIFACKYFTLLYIYIYGQTPDSDSQIEVKLHDDTVWL